MSTSAGASLRSLIPDAARGFLQGLQGTHGDREFLPAALEILETPPSPIQMLLLQSICILAAITIAWTFIGKIDVIAVAQGKVQPTGRVKLVQPLETGKVQTLFVANGSKVEAGQGVVALDDSELRAEGLSLAASLASLRAEAARRTAAIAAARAKDFKSSGVDWPPDAPQNILVREQRSLPGILPHCSPRSRASPRSGYKSRPSARGLSTRSRPKKNS
jgi:hemolysin D